MSCKKAAQAYSLVDIGAHGTCVQLKQERRSPQSPWNTGLQLCSHSLWSEFGRTSRLISQGSITYVQV